MTELGRPVGCASESGLQMKVPSESYVRTSHPTYIRELMHAGSIYILFVVSVISQSKNEGTSVPHLNLTAMC